MTEVRAYNANSTAATAKCGPIADWDVSAVTDMSELFKEEDDYSYSYDGVIDDVLGFNADIHNWDTSSVTNMYQMFYNAGAFNRPLSFDTSSVTDMALMFHVRSSPCPAPHLHSSPPLHAARAPRSPATSGRSRYSSPLPTPYALRSTLGRG
eukprot:scaffold6675_cov48-Phaeocystis_antarctica.AAC.1